MSLGQTLEGDSSEQGGISRVTVSEDTPYVVTSLCRLRVKS
jgi:hypothetical protein